MSANLFADLVAIRAFLASDVEAQVPAHLRSELRAAIKLLADVSREIDALPALLFAEGREMVALAQTADETLDRCLPGFTARTRTAMLSHEFDRPMGSLRGLMKLHEDALADADIVLAAIQQQLGRADLPVDIRPELEALAARYFALLAAQADARMQWQSVFPPLGRDRS